MLKFPSESGRTIAVADSPVMFVASAFLLVGLSLRIHSPNCVLSVPGGPMNNGGILPRWHGHSGAPVAVNNAVNLSLYPRTCVGATMLTRRSKTSFLFKYTSGELVNRPSPSSHFIAWS